mgnify:CR=1 FL=1
MSSSGDGWLRLRLGNLTCSSTAGAVVDIVVEFGGNIDGVDVDVYVTGNIASGSDVVDFFMNDDVDVVVDSKS